VTHYHEVIAERGPWLAALLAAITGAPSLLLPFMSDDWVHVVAASDGLILRTPFDFFRPLCNISYWIDWQIWGLTAAPFHFTNVVLASVAAGLVVLLLRRYTGDRFLAGIAGILFALHPYHITPVAWISARSDLLSAIFVLLAAWSYDRWRKRLSGLPLAALVLLQIALLAKEGAVVLPGVLIIIGLLDRQRRATPPEWLRGYLPMLALGASHFLFVRAVALGGVSLNHLRWIAGAPRNLVSYGATAIVPPPPEIFQAQPLWWCVLTALVICGLLLVAHKKNGHIPYLIWPAAAVFVVLLGPSLIGFNNRYFFLPGAASALALAALLQSAGVRIGVTVVCLLFGGWVTTSIDTWKGQFVASRASTLLIEGLVEAAQSEDSDRIVLVAAPHRVRGVPVTTDYSTVISFLADREIAISTATEFDFATAEEDALMAPRHTAIRHTDNELIFRLGVASKPYSRRVLPLFEAGQERGLVAGGTISADGLNGATVRIPLRSGTQVYVWVKEGVKLGDIFPIAR
jgi:hypothetical protein